MDFIRTSIALAISGLGLSAAHASDIRPASQRDLASDTTGRVAIICPADEVSRYISRGIAIEHSDTARYDIILAARHAAGEIAQPDFTTCSIRGAGGELQPVISARMTEAYSGQSDDWVVLRTQAPLPANTLRLRLATWTLRAEEMPDIALLAANPRLGCGLRPSQDYTVISENLFAHDCPSRPGLSGAPIVVMADGHMTVIGFHLGQLTELDTEGSRRIGIGRRIDAEIAQAIVDLNGVRD